jgi:hypothetical protein
VPIVKKRKFLGFLDKNNILGNLVAFMIFFFDFGSKSGSGRGWDMETQKIENFSIFWRKNDSRDFAGIYTFLFGFLYRSLPKSQKHRKFLESLAKHQILGTLVACTICLRFFLTILLQIRFAVVERLLGKGTTPKIVKNRNK